MNYNNNYYIIKNIAIIIKLAIRNNTTSAKVFPAKI